MELNPRSVREILQEMMSKANIQLDLAIASLGINDGFLAEEVIRLEKETNELSNQLFMHSALAIRTPRDAEDYINLFHIINAIDAISDSAANIAEIVIDNQNPFKNKNSVFMLFHEFVNGVKISDDSILIGEEEEDLNFQDRFGVDIMAIRRGNDILFGHNNKIHRNDMLYLRGPQSNVIIISELCAGRIKSFDKTREMLESYHISDLNTNILPHELLLKKLIDNALLIIDFAFLFQIEQEKIYRDTVNKLEVLTDKLYKEFIEETFNQFESGNLDKNDVFAFMKLAAELELLADESYKLAFGLKSLRRSELKILDDAMEASEENIELIPITIKSTYIGKSIHETELETEVSGEVFDVIGLRRKGQIIPYPKDDTKVEIGDVLIIKTYQDSDSLEDAD